MTRPDKAARKTRLLGRTDFVYSAWWVLQEAMGCPGETPGLFADLPE